MGKGWNGVESCSVGPHNRGKENVIGTSIRNILEQFGLFLVHTGSDLPYTYYNNFGTGSHIDHIAMPISMCITLDWNVRASVFVRSGRKLQLIQTIELRDHVPVAVFVQG